MKQELQEFRSSGDLDCCEIKFLSSIFLEFLSHGIRANLHSATPELLQLLTPDLRIARRESVGKVLG